MDDTDITDAEVDAHIELLGEQAAAMEELLGDRQDGVARKRPRNTHSEEQLNAAEQLNVHATTVGLSSMQCVSLVRLVSRAIALFSKSSVI